MPNTLILIPSRMSATRLPGKPLLKINNLSIISHVVKKAKKTQLGRVVVCAEDQVIVDDVIDNGGEAILTSRSHRSGTDRIFEAFKKLEINNIDFVLNLQGDEPLLDEQDIINLNTLMTKNNLDIGTLAAKIRDKNFINNKNIVKVITKEKLTNTNFSLALSFQRNCNFNKNQNIYHHLGIYAYNIKSLEKFINLKPSKNEIDNRLEQLRALDNDLDINVSLAKSPTIGIDTEEDYLALKKIMEYKS